MYAEVNLRIDERHDALAVPLDAVDRSGSTAHVFRVQASGLIQVVPVILGLENDRAVEIRSGLNEGDVIVVGRRAGLKDGQQVQVKTREAQVN